jgi:hypothetical protein
VPPLIMLMLRIELSLRRSSLMKNDKIKAISGFIANNISTTVGCGFYPDKKARYT